MKRVLEDQVLLEVVDDEYRPMPDGESVAKTPRHPHSGKHKVVEVEA